MKKFSFIILVLGLIISFYTWRIYIEFDIEKVNSSFYERYSQVVLDEDDNILGVYLNSNEEWQIKSEDEVGEKLKTSVLKFEDKRYYEHGGVDIKALFRTLKNNILRGDRSGGSTITMQVVKMLNPKPRTYINKYKEIIQSIKLERNFSKEEILLMYLNNAPYGGNIRGYKTAGLMYFQKEPSELTWAEASLLGVLPNSPGLINIEKNQNKLIEKRNRLLKKLKEEGKIKEFQYEISIKEPLPKKKYKFLSLAPHLTRRLTRENPQKIIRSTINKEIQQQLEKIGRDYQDYLKIQGINNLSVLIIDNKTYEAKGYLGSGDFFDEENQGQVDGIMGKRSPGSLLKPFLYGLAIDDGLITRETKVFDIPKTYSNYSPQNASKKYMGVVEARKALVKSLNLPFVSLLEEYGESKFFYFLKEVVNFPETSSSTYGLSLILGTKEMTVENLGKLYAGLANYGEFKNIRFEKNYDEEEGRQLISKGASYLTLDTIKDLERPGFQNLYKESLPISWKTGTSYGRRDGWAVGVTPKWTVVVWVGNFDGQRSVNLTGVKSGGTLMFKVFDILPNKFKNEFIEKDTKEIDVDRETGYRVDFETSKLKVKYPVSAKPLKLSPYYKKIYINNEEKEVDSRDKGFSEAREKIILNYPLEVVKYLRENNMEVENIYNKTSREGSLDIIYPTKNLNLTLGKDMDNKKSLIIKIANLKKQKIYWYLNEKYLGEGYEEERSLKLNKGEYTLILVGENGERAGRKFKVIDI